VICTRATADSLAYDDAFAAAPQVTLTTQACPRFVEFVEQGITSGAELLDAGVRLTAVPCPRLVPLIESDEPFGPETADAVRQYAEPLKEAEVDTVILGCTHYPLIRPIFQRVFGRGVTLVFSAEETAREVAETLARKGIENDPGREGVYRFLTTGAPEDFRTAGARFLQLPIDEVEAVELADLVRAAA